MSIDLAAFGWDAALASHVPPGCQPARVLAQHRDRWRVATGAGELTAELAGRLRHAAPADGSSLPVTGDWLAVAARPDEGKATIQAVLPRRSCLVRADPGPLARGQPVAANVDLVLLVAAADGYRAVNPRRLERAAALAWESGARPVLVLSKCDLVDDPDELVAEAAAALPGVDVLAAGLEDEGAVEALRALLAPGRTAVLLGASGVGKSTLTNRLLGEQRQDTGDVRDVDMKGRHTTTARELFLVPGGGAVIDTPGVRELGLWASDNGGLEATFGDVEALAAGCRFRDCAHEAEPGCAVQAAVDAGELEAERVESWGKLQRELARAAAKRDREVRRVEKARARKLTRTIHARLEQKDRERLG